MKYSADVSSSRRKARKAHFSSDSESRRVLMSAPLSKALRVLHKVRSMPVREGDEVMVKSGAKKGQEGTVRSVYRRKFVIHIERITRDKSNSNAVQVGIHPSKVEITKLKQTNDRNETLAKSASAKTRLVAAYAKKGGAVDTSDLPAHKVRDLLMALPKA